VFACTTKGKAFHSDVQYQEGDALLFGPETRGLPDDIIESLPPAQRVRIPMLPDSRSMNLSNAVSVFVYESWRQFGYEQVR
ncbi:MAG: TrmH family RNA methyltransferase, partial [Pseudomonadota bacterium]|nr:TrmH family RNA methyltransferase [Pseudomonadota bacterium]